MSFVIGSLHYIINSSTVLASQVLDIMVSHVTNINLNYNYIYQYHTYIYNQTFYILSMYVHYILPNNGAWKFAINDVHVETRYILELIDD